MYSQNSEEAVITAYFGSTTGRLLDIGAHDGIRLSNSRALIEQGWSAVLVEPSPIAFCKLLENTAEYQDKLSLWNVALVNSSFKSHLFTDSMGDFISSMNDDHLLKWGQHTQWRKFNINPLPVATLFEKEGYDFDFISIDVEGTNLELLQEIPPHVLESAKMICIEYDNWMQQIKDHMFRFRFKHIHTNGENLIFVK